MLRGCIELGLHRFQLGISFCCGCGHGRLRRNLRLHDSLLGSLIEVRPNELSRVGNHFGQRAGAWFRRALAPAPEPQMPAQRGVAAGT